MSPHEIFAEMSPETAARILDHLREKEKKLYLAAIDSLARQRKLRPVFVERKPRVQRHAWMQEAMGRKSGENVAAQLLQIWLIGSQSQLLCDFLDALGIAHDPDGTVETLPPEPPRDQLENAITGLVDKHDPEFAGIYLRAFQSLNETGWTALDAILESDQRLALGRRDAA